MFLEESLFQNDVQYLTSVFIVAILCLSYFFYFKVSFPNGASKDLFSRII